MLQKQTKMKYFIIKYSFRESAGHHNVFCSFTLHIADLCFAKSREPVPYELELQFLLRCDFVCYSLFILPTRTRQDCLVLSVSVV